MTAGVDAVAFDRSMAIWLQRWNKLMKLELPDAEREMHAELVKLAQWIDNTTEPAKLRKLLRVMDEVLPQLERLVGLYVKLKTGKA